MVQATHMLSGHSHGQSMGLATHMLSVHSHGQSMGLATHMLSGHSHGQSMGLNIKWCRVVSLVRLKPGTEDWVVQGCQGISMDSLWDWRLSSAGLSGDSCRQSIRLKPVTEDWVVQGCQGISMDSLWDWRLSSAGLSGDSYRESIRLKIEWCKAVRGSVWTAYWNQDRIVQDCRGVSMAIS